MSGTPGPRASESPPGPKVAEIRSGAREKPGRPNVWVFFRPRGARQWISRKRSRLKDRPRRRHQIHQRSLAAVRAHRQPATDDFAQRREVGFDSVKLLGSAARYAKSGHYFVENQDGPLLLGEHAQFLEKPRLRRHAPHVADDGFHDGRSNLVAMRIENGLKRRHVVEGDRERECGERGGNARAVGQAERRHTRAGLDQQAVSMAVVAAFEFQDLLATCARACHAQGGKGGFGARIHQAHPLDGRKRLLDLLGQFHFAGRAGAEARSGLENLGERLHHFRVAMAENQRAPRADVINVGVAVHVGHARALSARHKGRLAAHGAESAHGRIHAPGHQSRGAFEPLFRF